MDQSKKISEGAMLAGIYIILMILSLFIPMLLMVAIFVLPVPFIMYVAKHNWQSGLIMFVVTMLISFFIQPAIAIPLTAIAGISGIMVGEAIRGRLSPYETWARGTIGFVIGFVLMLLYSQFVFQVNIIAEFETMMRESVQFSSEIMEQVGINTGTEENLELIDRSITQMMTLVPVGIAISAMFSAFLSQWISYRIISRIERKHLRFPPFRKLQFPLALIWIYFLGIIITLFMEDPNTNFNMVINNVMTFTGLLLVLQGLSFLFYYAHYKQKSNVLPILVVVLTVIFPVLLLYFVRILGIIDLGFNLRKRLSNEDK